MPIFQIINDWLHQHGISPLVIQTIDIGLSLALLALLALVLFWLCRRFLANWLEKLVLKSSLGWDDALAHSGFFKRLAGLLPFMACYLTADILFIAQPMALLLIKRLFLALLVILILRIINTLLEVVQTTLADSPLTKDRPIRSYVDALRIILYVLAVIFIIAIIADKSPWGIFSVLGGLTAVFLLIFRTSLLGFVANLQLTSNDMMRVGDWITMDKYHADGNVVDITLHTVRVQNWDNTYTTIPTYAFMEDSFQNWRGMAESGGRRIKRALYIDMNSVRFCSERMLARFKKFRILRDYLQHKEKEIASHNAKEGPGMEAFNGRQQTNLGIFRAYVEAYLRAHDKINTNLTFLIRQLAPTAQGLPLEIYVFSSDKVWANYEAIQADIFDHLLAIIPEFELKVFQDPSGADFRTLLQADNQMAPK